MTVSSTDTGSQGHWRVLTVMIAVMAIDVFLIFSWLPPSLKFLIAFIHRQTTPLYLVVLHLLFFVGVGFSVLGILLKLKWGVWILLSVYGYFAVIVFIETVFLYSEVFRQPELGEHLLTFRAVTYWVPWVAMAIVSWRVFFGSVGAAFFAHRD